MIKNITDNIINRVKSKFLDFRISTKITLYYFLLLVLSTTISSLLYQKIYSDIIYAKVSSVSIQTLDTITSNIDSLVDTVNTYSKIILFDWDIQELLVNATENYSYDMQRKIYEKVMGIVNYTPLISSIYIYDNAGNRYFTQKSADSAVILSNITETSWYKEAANNKGEYILRLNAGIENKPSKKGDYVSFIRIINDISTQKSIGTLIINIPVEAIVKSYRQIVTKYGTYILLKDEKNNDITKYENLKNFDINKLIEDSVKKWNNSTIQKVNGTDYIISYLVMPKYDWKIISIMPFNVLLKESAIFSFITFIVVLLNGLLLFFGALFISRLITTPVKKLLKSMKGVEKGLFKMVDLKIGNDEIGKLKDGYNIMICEIEKLIDRIVEEQKVKRKAELDILQAQIKPHFLYNTFDAISSLALSGRNEEVYKVIKALGNYYRTSLSKGNEVITIIEEIETVRNYLSIQKVRYGDIFAVKWDIDERANKYKILKLILQPLVENALYHGIKPKGESGIISITTKYMDERLELMVEDDGVGISDATIQRIMRGENYEVKPGFGLRGTIERLRIFYGIDDVIKIENKNGSGTRVTITIPVKGEIVDVG
ncbi:MAG: sensor histidine kinase [Clostridiales bacterium]|nr:sensor histidine kinase [Clostridiales bacterium]